MAKQDLVSMLNFARSLAVSKKMRILYFHQHFSTPQGATGIRSYEMAKRLLHHGHQVTMVCGSYGVAKTGLEGEFRRGRREGMVHGIRVIEFDLSYSNRDGFLKRSWTFAKFALGSLGLTISEKYDLVFATTTPLTAGIPGIFARWFLRKPFVFEVRDLWPELPRAMGVIRNPIVLALMSILEWSSYRSAIRCVALSPGIAKGIAARGVSDKKIHMVPNGCDLEIFARDNRSPWRPEGIEASDLLAIFTGTQGQANGLDAVLDAAAVLKQRGRLDIKIAIVGDGKLKEKLMQRAQAEQLTNVIFHPPVNKAKLADLMAAADIGIQCLANVPAFYYGTSPNKFFDYISAGLPVLNNYPGWLAEMIDQHDCGYAVAPDDPHAFANALEQAHNNRQHLRVQGENALKLAKNHFDRHQLADRWVRWVVSGIVDD